jgi:hypothetical protein
MSNTFEFEQYEQEGERAFDETEWEGEAEVSRRRSYPPRLKRRFPVRPVRRIKRRFPFGPRRPGVSYLPIVPVFPWAATPLEPPPRPREPDAPRGTMGEPAPDDTSPPQEPSDAPPTQDAPADEPPAPSDAPPSDEPPSAEPASSDQQGESSRVRWSQDALNRALGLELEVSGFLNAPTRSALRMLQRQHGLPPHGQLDRITAATLRQAASTDDDAPPKPRGGCGCGGGHRHGGCGCADCRNRRRL